MVLLFRLVRIILQSLFRRRRDVLDESVMRFRVWPTDMDLNFHLNDGRYVSLTGLARVELLLRTGVLRRGVKLGWFPVVGATIIRYRREIRAFERFTLRSRILGWDEKWIYFEHRFEKNGDLAAIANARGVMRNREGAVPTAHVLALIGYNGPSPQLPDIKFP